MAEGRARYARDKGTWFLRLGGELRHTLAPALNALLDQALQEPATERFLTDLSEAESIDSTCLGMLARIANWARDRGAPKPIIVTTSDDITATLRSVCFDRLFELRGQDTTQTGSLAEVAPADAGQMTALVLEAHRRLCLIDAKNAAVFRDVVELLERERGREALQPRKNS